MKIIIVIILFTSFTYSLSYIPFNQPMSSEFICSLLKEYEMETEDFCELENISSSDESENIPKDEDYFELSFPESCDKECQMKELNVTIEEEFDEIISSFQMTYEELFEKVYEDDNIKAILSQKDTNENDCEEGCAFCDKTDNKKCYSCKSGYGYDSETLTCSICDLGFYSLGEMNKCLSCDSFNEENEEENQKEFRRKQYYANERGLSKCKYCPTNGFVTEDNTECFSIHSNSLESTGKNGIGGSTQCLPGYGLKNGICEECDMNEFSNGLEPCRKIDEQMFVFIEMFDERDDAEMYQYLLKQKKEEYVFGDYRLSFTPFPSDTSNEEQNQMIPVYTYLFKGCTSDENEEYVYNSESHVCEIKTNSNSNNQQCKTDKTTIQIDSSQCYSCSTFIENCETCILERQQEESVVNTNQHLKCLTCYEPYVPFRGMCIRCPDNYLYIAATEDEPAKCIMNSLSNCVHQINDKCYECAPGFMLSNGICLIINSCDVQSQGTCQQCSIDGITTNGICQERDHCKYSFNNECLECEPSFILDENNQCISNEICSMNFGETCVRSVDNYRIDSTIGKVIECDNNVEICINPHKEDIENKMINVNQEQLKQIDLSCNDDSYLVKDGITCKQIEDNKCIKTNSSDCVQCVEGTYLMNGECQSNDNKCNIQMYGYCNEEYGSCDEDSFKNMYCLQCKSNNEYLINGKCLTEDEIKTKYSCETFNPTTHQCDMCVDGKQKDKFNCEEKVNFCFQWSYETDECLSCENNYFLQNGECRECNGKEENGSCFEEAIVEDLEDNSNNDNENNENDNSNQIEIDQSNEQSNEGNDENENISPLKSLEINKNKQHCYSFSKNGCDRCNDGYYIENGICNKCSTENCKVCDNDICFQCLSGFSLSNENVCETNSELAETCDQIMPNNVGCAICAEGYYRDGLTCVPCHESCQSCIKGDECILCKENYFQDQQSLSINQTCFHYDNLTNCISKTSKGCELCEEGFYLSTSRCFECHENCTTCSNDKTCLTCAEDYIWKYGTNSECIYVDDVKHCLNATENSTCSSCEIGYELDPTQRICVEIGLDWGMIGGIIAAGVVMLLIIIGVILTIIIMFVKEKKREIEFMKQFKIFKVSTTKEIDFEPINGISNVVTNKSKIEVKAEGGQSDYIPVCEATEFTALIANVSKNRIKVQFTTKEEQDKYELNANPPLITLKKDQGCEVTFTVTPMCTCTIDDVIIISSNDMKTGETITGQIPLSFETQLSTRLNPDELIEEKKLGEGSFGIVYLGDYRGNRVAIKKMKQIGSDGGVDSNAMDEFEKEVSMLDKFRSDYLIHFYGACFIPTKICMVTEFAQYGSIQDLRNKRPDGEGITEKLRIKFCLDCAKGIKYLHDNGVLHRDIKPDNYLVVSLEDQVDVNCKLTDFGSSRNVNLLMTNMTFTKGIGTPVYMAPEVMQQEHYKKPADVYSFGVTMYEILGWCEAYPKSKFRFPWKIAELITSGQRLEKSENMTDEMYSIIDKAWAHNPLERETIDGLISDLNKIFNPITMNINKSNEHQIESNNDNQIESNNENENEI